MQAMRKLSDFSDTHGVERPLMKLVQIRASQINGCAYCLDLHTREARAAGETEARLHVLAAWRESPRYTIRERAALAWTEAVTLVADSRVPNEIYDSARAEFTESELVRLTLAVNVINCWNRFAIAFRAMHPTTDSTTS